jgi:DNA-binding protein HU-beta
MTKLDIINEISGKTGVGKIDVGKIVESLMENVKGNMLQNENIYLRGFGSFILKKRAKKMARNITKNTVVIVPEHFAPVFKPSKEFVAKIKSKKV